MIRVLFVGLLFCANLLANRDEVQPFENIGGFVQGTIVHTFTGPDTIQNIRVGDRLLSFDLETSKIVESRVTDTHQEQVDALTRIVVEGEEFYVNPEHRFYVADTHEWVAAKSLLPGFHVLLNKAKKHLIIDKVELVSGKSYIYDLTVEDTRNYFVGKHQVLVHNFAFVIPLFAWTIGEGITFLTAATLGALVTTTVIYAIKELSRYDPGDLSHLSRNFQARDRVDGDRAKADYPVDIYIRSRANTNPYTAPVGETVNVVDPYGNNIRVGPEEQISSSPNGDYQQIHDSIGRPTGVRLDRGGHKSHSDPVSQAPHAHRPDVKGDEHLPVSVEGK